MLLKSFMTTRVRLHGRNLSTSFVWLVHFLQDWVLNLQLLVGKQVKWHLPLSLEEPLETSWWTIQRKISLNRTIFICLLFLLVYGENFLLCGKIPLKLKHGCLYERVSTCTQLHVCLWHFCKQIYVILSWLIKQCFPMLFSYTLLIIYLSFIPLCQLPSLAIWMIFIQI